MATLKRSRESEPEEPRKRHRDEDYKAGPDIQYGQPVLNHGGYEFIVSASNINLYLLC